jgi:UDP-glucose 4-epimerase
MEANKKSILILGGAGFIGSNLIIELIKSNFHIRLFTRPSNSLKNLAHFLDQLELVYGDFMDEVAVRKAVTGVDYVIHSISTTLPATTTDSGIFDITSNLVPTVRLLENCLNSGVKKFIYISSGGTVYGEPRYIPIDEKHPLLPKSLYGHSKKAIENYISFFSLNHDLSTAVLRLSNPYGPYQSFYRNQGLVAAAFGCILDGRQFNIYGDGEIVRDYIYVSDVVQAIILSLENESNFTINISSGSGASILNILNKIESISGSGLTKQHIDSRKLDVQENILNNELASKIIDWKPQVGLDEGIRLTWDWVSKSQNR